MTLVLGAVAALGGALWVVFDALVVDSAEWSGIGDAGATDARRHDRAAGQRGCGSRLLPYAVYDAHGDFVARNLIMGGGLLLKLATVGSSPCTPTSSPSRGSSWGSRPSSSRWPSLCPGVAT